MLVPSVLARFFSWPPYITPQRRERERESERHAHGERKSRSDIVIAVDDGYDGIIGYDGLEDDDEESMLDVELHSNEEDPFLHYHKLHSIILTLLT